MTQTRLPRLIRSPEQLQSHSITERGQAILSILSSYRVLQTSMIIKLADGNEDVTHRHLQRLYHLGLINRCRLQDSQEFIYFLQPAARSIISTDADSIPALLSRSSGFHPTAGRLLFLEHELMISRFHFMLGMSCQPSIAGASLTKWHQGAELWNGVECLSLGKRLPHRPDAFFTLTFHGQREGGGQRANFFYEADRGTMTLNRMREKFLAHYEFVTQRQHQKKLGIKRLRAVLIEAPSISRAERLRDLAHSICDTDELFWFTTSEVFDARSDRRVKQTSTYLARPNIVLSKIWVSQISEELQSIIS